MATTAPTYDPIQTATKLATDLVADRKAILALQTSNATATSNALTKLKSAMSAFEGSLATMTAKKTLISNTATLSGGVGTASASAGAVGGSYSFYVERLATAGQVAYGGLSDIDAASAGGLTVTLADGTSFTVTLANADKQPDGKLTAKEIAAAINSAADNKSSVTASTMTIDGKQTLILTSNATGKGGEITLSASGFNGADADAVELEAALSNDSAKMQVMVAAQDALIWVGAKPTNGDPGISIEQSSNTFSVVDDVKMTFTKAQASGESPITLTVAADNSGTNANVQGFVDAFNKLNTVLNDLANPGDPAKGVAAGILATDSGVAMLRGQMSQLLRQKVGTNSLTLLGITAQRDGSLGLNTARLTKAIANDPQALDSVFGSASLTTPSGVMGDLDKLMNLWTSSTNGQLKTRNASVDRLQQSLTNRQAVLDSQYDSAYTRYLGQFTRLKTLQTQMESNTSLFDALFSKDS